MSATPPTSSTSFERIVPRGRPSFVVSLVDQPAQVARTQSSHPRLAGRLQPRRLVSPSSHGTFEARWAVVFAHSHVQFTLDLFCRSRDSSDPGWRNPALEFFALAVRAAVDRDRDSATEPDPLG